MYLTILSSSDGTLNCARCQGKQRPWHKKDRFTGFYETKLVNATRETSRFHNLLLLLIVAAGIWLKYCRYGVKHCPINQSRNLLGAFRQSSENIPRTYLHYPMF